MNSKLEQIGEIGKGMLSQSKFYMGYSRWDDTLVRYETWEESVNRVMQMHREKYKTVMTDELSNLMDYAQEAYSDKLILGAQRALQFGGEQLFKHEARMYNCTVSHVDRPRFFQEAMYMLLCGCGVGFSVQSHHIEKLPLLKKRSEKKSKIFIIPDSIEGWADAFGVLLASYFDAEWDFKEYKGCQVHFDFSKIRPKGSMISGGFKAPGPDGLRASLQKCEALLDSLFVGSETHSKMPSIVAYDFVMHMSDAVQRAAGLMLINLATILFQCFTSFAASSMFCSSNRTSGLFIQPVILTPISASFSIISLDACVKYLKFVYPA